MSRKAGGLQAGSLLAVLLTSLVAAGAEPTVTIRTAEARRFREALVAPEETVKQGFLNTIKLPAKQVLVAVWLELDVKGVKDANGNLQFQLDAEKMSLVDADKKRHPPVGSLTRDGRLRVFPPNFYFGGANNSGKIIHELAFVVPEKQTKFTLEFGPAKHALELQGKVETRLDPASMVRVSLSNIEAQDKLGTTARLGTFNQPIGEFELSTTASTGKYLFVDLEVAGLVANSSGSGNFVFAPSDFGVLYAGQVYVAPIGFVSFGKFQTGFTAFNAGPTDDGKIIPITATLVYPLPKGVSKFEVLYLMQPVAKGSVPK